MVQAIEQPRASLVLRGFGRALLKDAKTGRTLADKEFTNVVTDVGIRDFIVNQIHSDLSGSAIGFAGIGSNTTVPATDDTGLGSEFETRKNVVGALVASRTLRNTWSYATNEATQSSVGEVGLFRTNSGAPMFNHATFTQSLKTTNQTLAFTYDVVFATA